MALSLVCRLGRGRAQQRNDGFCNFSVCRKAAPPALALKPDNSAFPCVISGTSQAAAPAVQLRVSESVASKSVCRPFKRKAWDSSFPVSHSATIFASL